ncbi:MAG: Rieske 2Fe-2S domain-containing protein [Rhodobiaceae bacterium]|nr:Rieske 2Fe-2S domain-containing protein [Rhodobiaceae bacterium]
MPVADDLLEELAAIATAPMERARAMPAAVYTDDAIHALEQAKIFARSWICLGRADAMAEPGSYLTFTIGDQPVMAMRQKDGSVKAFANVCRHRMMVMLSGAGSCKRIVCPYHAWTYDIDGRLIGAPQMQKTDGFDKAAHALPELRAEVWKGWVYVSLNHDIAPVAEILADLEPMVDRYRMEHYVEVVTQDHVWDTNWKLLTENFMESYHLPIAHRETVGAWFPVDETQFPDDCHDSFTYETFTKNADATYGLAHKDNTVLEGEWRRTTVMPTVFPTHMYVLAPDHLWYLTLMPKGTGQVHVRFGAALAPEVLAGLDDPETFLRDTIGFFDKVNDEDRFVVEGIYKGARAPLSTGGPLSWMEREIHDFIRYLARTLAG